MEEDTLVFWIVVVVVVCVAVVSAHQWTMSFEEVIIEGKVVDVDISNRKYMEVTFDNGEVYRIKTNYESTIVDFTVNSKLIIKLEYSSFWLVPNTDNIWGLTRMVKVPSD